MKRYGSVCGESGKEDKLEAWARRVVMFMGLIGPVTLISVLLWIVHWDATQSSRVVHQQYFPSAYVNTVAAVEQPVDTF